ncbi:MAG: hypothetical protein ACJAWV_004337 [Flammeovirgaceae bacterium]|jgi:hypothetical protein
MLQLVDLNKNDIMNTIEMATNSAKKLVKERFSTDMVFLKIKESNSCWIFYYQSKKYAEHPILSNRIVDNDPVIVNKEDGVAYFDFEGLLS